MGDLYTRAAMASNASEESVKASWALAKSQGMDAFQGNAHLECQALLTLLREVGVHVILTGETEDFDKLQNVKGAPWVSKALKKNL
ncbi:hypothetical protein [Frigoribacterium sp. Leaf44]|uniref:hypothetical protein n=1 Tax=Frigoribacterium sp. Leaf44 TaxID=1736220 RepID=UPI000A51197A|nr:hypothetical protein [Frigoribacterium sp. Leaf44]